MELKGTVVAITDPKEATATLTKQMLVIEWKNDRGYANKTAFEFKKSGTYDTISKIANIGVGQTVTVMYNEPTSREHNGNWYTGVEGWGVKVEGASTSQNQPTQNSQPKGQPIADNVDSEDLPF